MYIYIKYNYNRKQAAPVKCREEDIIDNEPDCTNKTHTQAFYITVQTFELPII
jgi:hypothetical protein